MKKRKVKLWSCFRIFPVLILTQPQKGYSTLWDTDQSEEG